jgi:hypothetical protein
MLVILSGLLIIRSKCGWCAMCNNIYVGNPFSSKMLEILKHQVSFLLLTNNQPFGVFAIALPIFSWFYSRVKYEKDSVSRTP